MIDRRGIAIAALIGLATALPAAAQTADRDTLRAALMKAEADSWNWMKVSNVAALRDYLADDVTLIFADGTRFSKAEFLKAVPTFGLKSFAIEKDYAVAVIAPDVATLIYRVTYTAGNPAATVKAQSASTYVRRGGKWLSVLYQETALK